LHDIYIYTERRGREGNDIYEIGNNIGIEGVKKLIEALKANNVLSRLDLRGKGKGIINIVHIVENPRKTQKCTENVFGLEGVKILEDASKVQTTLKILPSSSNN